MSNRQRVGQRSQADADARATQLRCEEALARWAKRYIWWKSVPDALRYPDRIIAQVMNIGDYDDLLELIATFGEEALREVIRHAEPGEFNGRSWAYWHYRLGMVPLEASAPIPPLPTRSIP